MDEQRSPGTALQFLCMGLGRSLCIIEPHSSAKLSNCYRTSVGGSNCRRSFSLLGLQICKGSNWNTSPVSLVPSLSTVNLRFAIHNGPQRGALRRKCVRTFHHNIRPTFASGHCVQKNFFEDVKVSF